MIGACSLYTTDQGQSWQSADDCSAVNAFGGIGQRGGFVFGAGVFVIVDDEGDYCSTPDMGASWHSGSVANYRGDPVAQVGKVFFTPMGRTSHASCGASFRGIPCSVDISFE